ncbi:MAG: substrate-binding domain-containing protein [Pseudomonadota bacterium]
MNLKSLARTLGVSKTTVSRALNGYPEVNVLTRERVLAAAKEAGYEANPMARSLAVGRSNVYGIVYPLLANDLGDPMFMDVVRGMSAALEPSKMGLIIAPVSQKNELQSYEQMVRGRRVDGLVVSRTQVHDERIAFLLKKGFPFVAFGRTETTQPYAWFDFDNAAGMRTACEMLLGHGHQRIALISAPLEFNFASQRRASFIARMAEAGLACDPRHLIDNSLDRRSAYQAMQQLLACSPRPTAVIVDNHLSGVGAVRALLDAGIEIGSEVSVIVWGSVADSLWGSNVTTMDLQHCDHAGAKMMEMLSAVAGGADPANQQVLWQPTLLPGATVGPCPT